MNSTHWTLLTLSALACQAPNPHYAPTPAAPAHFGRATPAPSPPRPTSQVDASASQVDASASQVDASTSQVSAMTAALGRGLTLYLPLDERPGTSVAVDASGKRASAQLRSIDASAAWTEGAAGQGLALRGTSWNGYLDVSGSSLASAISQQFSIALWVRRGESTSTSETLVSRHSPGARGPLFALALENGALTAVLNSTAAYNLRLRANGVVPGDRWAHVAMTYDLQQVRLYVDGNPVGVAPYAQAVPLDTTSFMIGGLEQQNRSVGARFAGHIDEVSLHTRTLTPAEVGALAAGIRPR